MLRRIILLAAAIGAALAIALLVPAGSPAETAGTTAPRECVAPTSIARISSTHAAPSSDPPARAAHDTCHHEVTNA